MAHWKPAKNHLILALLIFDIAFWLHIIYGLQWPSVASSPSREEWKFMAPVKFYMWTLKGNNFSNVRGTGFFVILI
jgi:hypothetical protein